MPFSQTVTAVLDGRRRKCWKAVTQPCTSSPIASKEYRNEAQAWILEVELSAQNACDEPRHPNQRQFILTQSARFRVPDSQSEDKVARTEFEFAEEDGPDHRIVEYKRKMRLLGASSKPKCEAHMKNSNQAALQAIQRSSFDESKPASGSHLERTTLGPVIVVVDPKALRCARDISEKRRLSFAVLNRMLLIKARRPVVILEQEMRNGCRLRSNEAKPNEAKGPIQKRSGLISTPLNHGKAKNIGGSSAATSFPFNECQPTIQLKNLFQMLLVTAQDS
ncbi:hypothetical protein BKA70DRAFT_1236967 [Coprinopsis sp. MPI-PUGE-AT-0042]|nr:hypothetical protein BKA70DRAFT_1236967 [Coprinopsis sp. MPI-PUGE-AT-0042]